MNVIKFNVGKHITLKLEDESTVIYVNGQKFLQCKHLLLRLTHEKNNLSNIISIDDAERVLRDGKEENGMVKFNITPKQEFWGHSSNLQAWYEHHYDTVLLHSNLAFPLLKKLYEIGDNSARKVFKEEIAKRLAENYAPINEMFIEENYLSFLSNEELKSSYPKEIKIERLILASRKLIKIPPLINTLPIKGLKILNLTNNNFTLLPSFILKHNTLEILLLDRNQLKSLPDSLCDLTRLKKLNLSCNQLKTLPNNIEKLKSLEILNLYCNNLMTIPDSIGNLASLKKLILTSNRLQKLPESIGNLINLEQLSLRSNKLLSLPPTLINLKNLRSLDLSKNKFRDTATSDFVKMLSLKVARNNANSLIQKAEQFLSKNNSATSEQKSKILENIKKLKESMRSDSFEEIELKTHDLSSY